MFAFAFAFAFAAPPLAALSAFLALVVPRSVVSARVVLTRVVSLVAYGGARQMCERVLSGKYIPYVFMSLRKGTESNRSSEEP